MGDREGDGAARGTAGTGGRAARAAWRVRIRSRGTRQVIGSGVLLGGDTVLTCAHVLPGQDTTVTVEFPEIEGAESSSAAVVDDCWIPPRGDGRGDVALLRVRRPPPGGHSAPLLRAASPRGTQVEMCGYAASVQRARGAAFRATVSLPFGERVQLNPRPGHLPRPGFSGGPVLDMNDPPSVLGIVVTGYYDSGAPGHSGSRGPGPLVMAHMIPIETVVRYLPGVLRWVEGPRGVDPSLTSGSSLVRIPDPGYAERLAAWLGGGNRSPVYVTEVERDSNRDRTLQRALALADRELSAEAPAVLSTDPATTVPPVGSLDLAVDARGATAEEVVVRVAERMNLKEPDPARALERLRGGRMPLTIAVLGVDGAADPAGLVGLCGEFAEHGCRLLLVFAPGTRIDQAAERQLVLRHRTGALAERLDALDGRLRDLAHAAVRLAGVDPPGHDVTRLRLDLSWLRHAHRTGADLPPQRVREALGVLERRTRRAERDAAAAWEAAERGYERRAALRGELRTYRHLAVRHGRIEDVDLDREYRAAHEALHTGRFEPRDAADAVARYVAAVRGVLGWPPEEPEEPVGSAEPAEPGEAR